MRGHQECGLRQVWMSNGHHFSDTRHASAGQSGGQEDLGLPIQNVSAMGQQSWVLSTLCVLQDLCWESSGLMSELCSWTLA